MAGAAFALNPARHFALNTDADADLPASTRWADAPPLNIHPLLREYGEAARTDGQDPCAALEHSESQITLRLLGERLLQLAAGPVLTSLGFAFTLGTQHEHRELVAACRTLLGLRHPPGQSADAAVLFVSDEQSVYASESQLRRYSATSPRWLAMGWSQGLKTTLQFSLTAKEGAEDVRRSFANQERRNPS